MFTCSPGLSEAPVSLSGVHSTTRSPASRGTDGLSDVPATGSSVLTQPFGGVQIGLPSEPGKPLPVNTPANAVSATVPSEKSLILSDPFLMSFDVTIRPATADPPEITAPTNIPAMNFFITSPSFLSRIEPRACFDAP